MTRSPLPKLLRPAFAVRLAALRAALPVAALPVAALPVAALALALAACATTADAKKMGPLLAQANVQDDSAPDVVTYGRRDDVQRYAADIAQRRGLDPEWVASALQRARYVPTVARLIMPPPAGSAKNWAAYRGRFVEPVRIRAGVEFWRANRQWLALAEERYGVPAEIIVGVIGVETIYSRQMGGFRVIDTLATLSFDFPTGRRDRSAFFRSELEEFLVMCKNEGLDPVAPKGSYAGAMGMPQFMPSSFNKYAVDFDGDGHVNLAGSSADAIGSVAHYLAEFGWQRGMPTRFSVSAPVDTADRAALLAPDILPTFTVQEFAQRGAQLDAAALAYGARYDAMREIALASQAATASGPTAPVAASASAPEAASAPASAASAPESASSAAASAVGEAASASASLAASASAPVATPPDTAASQSAADAPAPAASSPSKTTVPPPFKLALVELQNGDAAPSYIAGTPNFYVVTRYNWSSYYALAVIELGEAVAREVARDGSR